MAPTSEDRLTSWLSRYAPGGTAIGDDVAELGRFDNAVITVDQQVEGTHFPTDLDPALLARRLLEVNLSDIAASGSRPRAAVAALAAPTTFDHRRFLGALSDACQRRDLTLVGGDLARSPRVSCSLTVLGRRPRRGRLLRRDAGRAGDRVWLGGSVGEAAMGRHLVALGARLSGRRLLLPSAFRAPRAVARAAARALRRHLEPTAQIALGEWLGQRRRAAVIDVSDGLGLDLTRLCQASGVGSRIDGDAIPLAEDAERLARRLGGSAADYALGGGEDYVLLFSLPATVTPPARFACAPIGRLRRTQRLTILVQGEERSLEPSGWSHLDAL